jgi:hypothetical protein
MSTNGLVVQVVRKTLCSVVNVETKAVSVLGSKWVVGCYHLSGINDGISGALAVRMDERAFHALLQLVVVQIIRNSDIVLRRKGGNKGCVRIQIDRGVPPFVGEVNGVAGVECAFERRLVGERVLKFHPLSAALVFVVVGNDCTRRVEDPVFATVEGFGKAGSVYVPLDARAAVANTKGKGDELCNTCETRRQFVELEKFLPFVSVRFAKKIPCFVRKLIWGCFKRSPAFVQVLLQRDGSPMLRKSVTAR